jgi:hypothetical protein
MNWESQLKTVGQNRTLMPAVREDHDPLKWLVGIGTGTLLAFIRWSDFRCRYCGETCSAAAKEPVQGAGRFLTTVFANGPNSPSIRRCNTYFQFQSWGSLGAFLSARPSQFSALFRQGGASVGLSSRLQQLLGRASSSAGLSWAYPEFAVQSGDGLSGGDKVMRIHQCLSVFICGYILPGTS